MIFFSKKKKKFDVLKLFIVVKSEEAMCFEIGKCIIQTLHIFEDIMGTKPDFFELNYGSKTWKKYDNFKGSIKKIKSDKITHFSAFDLGTESYISINNPIVNRKNILPNELSFIMVSLVINKPFLNFLNTSDRIKKFLNYFNVDYGYGLTLDNSFDFVTENKIKRSMFGMSSSSAVNKRQIDWTNNITRIKNGVIKKIYPYNLLNKSQMSSKNVSELMEKGIGDIMTFNEGLVLWTLNEYEYLDITL